MLSMKALAVDTSSVIAAVAVMEDGVILGEYILNNIKKHSQKLIPMISGIMKDIDIVPKDIDVFAACTGPGSFTGLRIGITTVKAMAYAVQKPVVGIPSLDILAFNIPMTDKLICPMIDARNNQVYTAVYLWKGEKQKRISDYMGIHINELADLLRSKNKEVIFTGDAVDIYKKYFIRELGSACMISPGSHRLQRASTLALLALGGMTEGLRQKSEDLIPFYLRKSSAEIKLAKKRNRQKTGIDNG
jgi:tRNA threonylcarbamoyladenosine biosynthesis protein TsaB